jgi:hypothetical protein
MLINSDYRNDIETHELVASDVVPHCDTRRQSHSFGENGGDANAELPTRGLSHCCFTAPIAKNGADPPAQ